MNENLNESDRAEMVNEFKPPNGIANGSQRSGSFSGWRSGEGGELDGFWRKPRRDIQGLRCSTLKYSEDGPSNFHARSSYGYGEPVNKQNNLDELTKVEYLEHDRAELLRKLEELKDQLSRSCDVKDKAEEKVPLDWRSVHHEAPYGPWGPNRGPSQYSMVGTYSGRPPYASHYPEPPPYMNRHSFYPSMHTSNQVQRFGNPLRSQIFRRAPHQELGALQQPPPHPYFSGNYLDSDMDPFESYPPNMNHHHPSCSCFHCCSKHPQVLGPVSPTAFHNKMFSDVPKNPMFYHHENPSAFGPRDYNPKIANPPNPQSHTRWPSDLNSEMGSFVRRRPPPPPPLPPLRVVLATGGRRCRPVAGGSPFVTCCNCFELLQLPKKILLTEKNQKKVRCGSCSTVILFAVVNKKLVSVHTETKKIPQMVDDSPNVTVSGGTLHSHVHENQPSMNFSSEDYDNSGYDFQSLDREVISSSTGMGFRSSKSEEMRSHHSSSPYSPEDEDSPEGNGNQSGRSEQEKGEPKKDTSRQNSLKDASLATEMEVSFNEYSNTGTSLESGDASRDEIQPALNKRGQSFFAEKLSGPVHPGQYWYDSRAGFWGVMGGPCLGIILPVIEEFNYPMLENCAVEIQLNEETILDCWYVTDLSKLFLYRGISCLIDWFGLVCRNVVYLGFEEKKKKKKKKKGLWVEIGGERSCNGRGNSSGAGICREEAPTKENSKGQRWFSNCGSGKMLGFMIKVGMEEMVMAGGGSFRNCRGSTYKPVMVMTMDG
ncbi:Protein ENHANCED DISEASE RESISTANCE 4 [Camellia lanceoleosa]|uniref:Protein ENHANCED DISEASE RESISTANCE 4 n=1 Tax=Camellia lanceoleosa TaxID=1840588 RepID=A0ACC0IDI3_9ERIC|nr:Protein ENHANCED DISEASE RESISTANCE 4 [Camellia lanceoleosa]